MHRLSAILLLVCSWGVHFAARAQEQPPEQAPTRWQIESPEGFVEYEADTGVAIATNTIVVRYGEATLTARRARVNQTTGQAVAEGDVRLERLGQVWQGQRLEYNFKTGRLHGENFRTGQAPLFARGEHVIGDTKAEVYVGSGALLTTDDYAGVGYSIRTRQLTIVPGEYVEAKHAVLYLGKVPVFYFPFYRRSLKDNAGRILFTPGYRSVDGPFLLTSYNWYWNEKLDGTLHLDGRVRRGVGLGPDFHWHLPRFGEGLVKSYYIHDLEPGEDPFTDEPLDENRYRIWFGHQAEVRTNLTAKALIRYQSDPFITRDFFESEYRENIQPNSFVEVNQRWSNFTLDLLVQPRVNDFFETVERLPDVKLTGLPQQIGATPLYYESDSSVGYFRRKFAEDTNAPYAALRADTFHQVTLPWTFFNWLNVIPRVGGRFTHYGEAHLDGGVTDERDRGVFNTGAEINFKASRVWPGVASKFWQIDGLRHIIQPSVNYAYVPRPNARPPELPQFDYTVPTTELLPIEFPDFNAIDAIDSQNVLRLGLRNKLQTKRRLGIENVVNWAVFTDWRLTREEGQPTFSDVFSDLDLQPFAWLLLTSEIRYDINDGRLREANHIATITPGTVWSWRVGQRYLESLAGTGPDSGNNTFFSVIYYRFNENWGVRLSQHFEARDGTLEEQQYTVYRDFRSWTGALTFRVRDRREASTDYTVAFTLSLKAFPRYGLGDDLNRPARLLGY